MGRPGNTSPEGTTCPDCGRPVPANSATGKCENCGVYFATMHPESSQPIELGKVRSHTLLDFCATDDGATVLKPGDGPPKVPVTKGDTTKDGQKSSTVPRMALGAGQDTGKKIGHYVVMEEIGRGGMGVVYKAFDPTLKRVVALKVLIGGEHASTDAIARFRREAEAVAKLGNHPGIVPVYDMGNEGNLHFFAMAFVEGKSLSQLIKAGDLTPRRSLIIAEQVARALHFAHIHGVLHRDVKPDNILLDGEGVPSLTDFGLAKDVQDDSRLTRSGTTMGTPQYMPPEQADGILEKIDARSDVYSLGATIYEMLAHVPPFMGASYQNVIFKVLNEEVASPRKRNPAIPRDAETICLKALEKEPERRYASAEVMAEDIRRYLDGDPITARPVSILYRVSKRVRRNIALYATGAAGAAALLFALVFFLGVKPAIDRRSEIAADTAVLEEALERRLEPERKADALLEEAETLLSQGDTNAAVLRCDRVQEIYAPLQGRPPEPVPAVRHDALLTEPRFAPLQRPLAFPLARALALKARALEKTGDTEGALSTWLLAYARAKPSSDPDEAAVCAPALLQIGRRLLDLRDLERATATFRKFLRTYPGHEDSEQAWFGLGLSLWSEGRFALAHEVLSRLGASKALTREQRSTLQWTLPLCRRFSQELVVHRANTGIFTGDLEGDGRSELFLYDPEDGLSVYRLEGETFAEVHRVPTASLFETALTAERAPWGVRWCDLHGKGKGGLLGLARVEGRDVFFVLPLGARAEPGRALWQPVEPGRSILLSADLDGDGTVELFSGARTQRGSFAVYRIVEDRIVPIGENVIGSYCNTWTTADVDGDGGEDVLLHQGEFSHFQAWRVSWRGPGHPVDFRPLSPYRYKGPFLGSTRRADGGSWIWVSDDSNGDDRRIQTSIAEASFALPRGLHRIRPGSDEAPRDFTASFPGARPVFHRGQALEGEDLLVCMLSLPGERPSLGLRSGDPERLWAFRRFSPADPLRGFITANLDDDPEEEILAWFRDEIRVFGAGNAPEVKPETILGSDAEAEDLSRLENTLLATAIEMASMNWTEQALELFRRAREEALTPFEVRRSLLGEADCLVRLRRAAEAVPIYRDLVRSSAAGITEEVFSLARLLHRQGSWKAIYDFTGDLLEHTPLPDETRRWAEDLRQKTEPLLRLNHGVTLVPVDEVDDTFIAQNPMSFRALPDGGGLEVFSNGSERDSFGRVFTYHGGPFRLVLHAVLHRLEWTAYVHAGLFRLLREGETAVVPSAFYVLLETGHVTNVPAVKTHFCSNAGPGTSIEAQQYPPDLPTEYVFTLEYAPDLDRASLRVEDRTHGREWERDVPVPSRFPPGTYCLGFVGSQLRGYASFQSQLTVKRFELFTSDPADQPTAWEPSEDALRCARAQGALVMGDIPRALALARGVGPETPDYRDTHSVRDWARNDAEPSQTALARLVEALALLRDGREDAVAEPLRAALQADPARVVGLVGRSADWLDERERRVVGRVLGEALTADRGALALRVAAAWRTEPRSRTRDLQKFPEPLFEQLEEVLKQGRGAADPSAFLQALFWFLFQTVRPSLVEAACAGTPLKAEARRRCQLHMGSEAENVGDSARALGHFEAAARDFPDDAECLNALAWQLVMAHRTELRDPGRARELAERAVIVARRPQSRFAPGLPAYLDTLAHAHWLLGDLRQAIRIQNEAVTAASNEEMRKDLANTLAYFQELLAKQERGD